MAGVAAANDIESASPKPSNSARPKLSRWMILIAVFGAVFLLSVLMIGTGRRLPNHMATSQEAVSTSHCTEFISLAKAKYGSDWKLRLDPRDTTCAQQIQQEWQSQWNPRELPPEPVMPAMPISEPSAPSDAGPAPDLARRLNPDTYCLNVISLAKAKYGPDWTQRVSPTEAANCGAQIQTNQ